MTQDRFLKLKPSGKLHEEFVTMNDKLTTEIEKSTRIVDEIDQIRNESFT